MRGSMLTAAVRDPRLDGPAALRHARVDADGCCARSPPRRECCPPACAVRCSLLLYEIPASTGLLPFGMRGSMLTAAGRDPPCTALAHSDLESVCREVTGGGRAGWPARLQREPRRGRRRRRGCRT